MTHARNRAASRSAQNVGRNGRLPDTNPTCPPRVVNAATRCGLALTALLRAFMLESIAALLGQG